MREARGSLASRPVAADDVPPSMPPPEEGGGIQEDSRSRGGGSDGDRPSVAEETPSPAPPVSSPDEEPSKQAGRRRSGGGGSRVRGGQSRSPASRDAAAPAERIRRADNRRSRCGNQGRGRSGDSRGAAAAVEPSPSCEPIKRLSRGDGSEGRSPSRSLGNSATAAAEQCNPQAEERPNKSKKDRNKDRREAPRSGSRHKSQNSGHHCVCRRSCCRGLALQFESADHPFKRRLIQFRVPAPQFHNKWTPWLEALLRHLQVPENEKANCRTLAPRKGTLFVAAHHFTPECVDLYFGGTPKKALYKERLRLEDAQELLRGPLDPGDRDDNGCYMVTPSFPMQEARQILQCTLKEDVRKLGRKSKRRGERAEELLSREAKRPRQELNYFACPKLSLRDNDHAILIRTSSPLNGRTVADVLASGSFDDDNSRAAAAAGPRLASAVIKKSPTLETPASAREARLSGSVTDDDRDGESMPPTSNRPPASSASLRECTLKAKCDEAGVVYEPPCAGEETDDRRKRTNKLREACRRKGFSKGDLARIANQKRERRKSAPPIKRSDEDRERDAKRKREERRKEREQREVLQIAKKVHEMRLNMWVCDLGMGSGGTFMPFDEAWARAERIFNQSRSRIEWLQNVLLSSVLPKDHARDFYARMGKGVFLTTLGIQTLKKDSTKGRKDALARYKNKVAKNKARSPCHGPDLHLIRSVLVLRSPTLVYCFLAQALHIRPHFSDKTSVWNKLETTFDGAGVEVVAPECVGGCIKAIQQGALLYDSSSEFVRNLHNDWILRPLIGEVMNHVRNISNDESRSDAGEQIRLDMGFSKAQPRNRGASVGFKHVELSEASKSAIRHVGNALEKKAREHYNGSFGNRERTNFVSERMSDLLDLRGQPWIWEYIDLSVTYAGCTRRHCDYNNDYRPGYDIAAIHSYPALWKGKMWRVNMIFTTRYNVGAQMRRITST